LVTDEGKTLEKGGKTRALFFSSFESDKIVFNPQGNTGKLPKDYDGFAGRKGRSTPDMS